MAPRTPGSWPQGPFEQEHPAPLSRLRLERPAGPATTECAAGDAERGRTARGPARLRGTGAPTRSLCRRGHRRGQPDVALGDGRGRPLLGRHLGPRLQPPPAARESPRQPPTRPPPSPCQTQAAGPTPRPPWRAPNEGSALTRGRCLSPHPPRARARMARGKPRPERPTRNAESEAPLPASLALPRRAARAVVPTKPARTARGGGPGQHWAGGWTGVHGRSPGKLGSLRGRVLIYLLTYFSVTIDS